MISVFSGMDVSTMIVCSLTAVCKALKIVATVSPLFDVIVLCVQRRQDSLQRRPLEGTFVSDPL